LQNILRIYFGEARSIGQQICENMKECIKKISTNLRLYPSNRLIENVIQLRDLVKCGHAVILTGNAGIGKTVTWKVS
jgi:hypothetical protein